MVKVQVVLYEKGWIVEEIAKQWLKKFNSISNAELVYDVPKPGAETYIHFIFSAAKVVPNAINYVYVTHIDSIKKAYILQNLFTLGVYFITMSSETKEVLQKIIGNQKSRILICNPESLHFKKDSNEREFVFGYFSRNYSDGRKNNELLKKISELVNNGSNCKLLIYGKGWKDLFYPSELENVLIDESEFNKQVYIDYLKRCNYVLYLSKDEGAISILDASTLNIPVITFSKGFHKDINLAPNSILCKSSKELLCVLNLLIKSFSNHSKYLTINETCVKIIETKKENLNDLKPSIWRIILFEKITLLNVYISIKHVINYFLKILLSRT